MILDAKCKVSLHAVIIMLQTNNIVPLFTVACFYVFSLPSQYMCICVTKESFKTKQLPTTNMKKLQYQHVFNLTAVKQPNLHLMNFIISFQNWHVLHILLPNKRIHQQKIEFGQMDFTYVYSPYRHQPFTKWVGRQVTLVNI